MRKILVAGVFLLIYSTVFSQASNTDYKAGPINIALPKTPESQGFDKYGNIPVSEFSGSANISVPIYTVSSKFLQVPISLSYSAGGIKVNQEASCVGLGWDLIAGGRITVETRGSVDNDGVTPLLYSPTQLKYGMQKLFNRLGSTGGPLSILTYASTCQQGGAECDTSVTHAVPDHWATIKAMADFGVGEPDMFRANFLGNSLTFFFDKITDSLRWWGEKSLFDISFSKDGFDRINSWTVTDNMGNKYYFNQKETTTLSLPPLGGLYSSTSTTAWLLTKVLHPTGDSIVLSYANSGNAYPANEMSASMSFMEKDRTISYSDDSYTNSTIQQPMYLTRIESSDVQVDFILGTRDDIKGAGSKRVNEIRIIDKVSASVKRKVNFGYDYFSANLESYHTALPDSVTKYYKARLKLNSVTLNDSSTLLQTPYKFYYNNTATVPEKYSFGQDHWGYYNGSGGSYGTANSPKNMIPNTGLGTALNYTPLNGYSSSRECYAPYLVTMMLDSVVYPTGGSSKMIFEPHVSTKFPSGEIIGGGLRIKTIRHYASGRLANSVEYTYAGGKYMGTIQYYTSSWQMQAEPQYVASEPEDQKMDNLTTNGAMNDNDILIGYGSVTQTQRDAKGNSNGYVIKNFGVSHPQYGSSGLGFDLLGAHWPSGSVYDPNIPGYLTYQNLTQWLYPSNAGFPPTPAMYLDGKPTNEQYYDNANNLLKSVNYYYTQADYSQKFYRVRVRDTRVGGSTVNGSNQFDTRGQRRYIIFVSPARSFYTLTDSVVEKVYQGANYMTNKKVFKYNSYFQPEYVSSFNSDGTQTIAYTRTSATIAPPAYAISPTGDAIAVNSLRTNHIYDLPIEEMVLNRNSNGDSVVVQGKLTIYQGPLPKKVYVLETDKPLTYKTQFIPFYYDYPNYPNSPSGGNYSVKMDTKYRLYTTADYSSNGKIWGMQTTKSKSAYVWDESYDDLIAQVINADSVDIAFTSFETAAKGRWNFNPASSSSDATAPTGAKVYALTSGSVSLTGLGTKTYTVSYWSKNGAQNVNGSTGVAGPVIGLWTYYEHAVTNPASGTITVSGSGTVDELRLYPKGSLMTSYTFAPIYGMTSQCDPNNRISYYEYDIIGRVSRIRDEKRNILRQYEYKFKDVFNYPYVNAEQSQSFTKACSAGYAGSQITYTVPAGTYGSYLNVGDANRKAVEEITAYDGQTLVNATGTCTPYFDFVTCCGYSSSGKSFTLTGTGSVNFSITIYGNTSGYGQIGTLSGALFLPSTTRYVPVTVGGNSYTVVFYTTGQVNIMGPSYTGSLQLTGTYAL